MADVSQITVGGETRDIKDTWSRKMSIPNWSAAEQITLTPNSSFTASKDGWIVGHWQGESTIGTTIKVNNIPVSFSSWAANHWHDSTNLNIPISKDDTLTISHNPSNMQLYFCPIED